MSNDKPLSGSRTQLGHVAAKASEAFADTLTDARPAPPVATKHHAHSEDLMTSAPVSSIQGTSQTSGAVTLSGARVSEALARELIVRAMAREGIALQSDYAYCCDDLLVTLDGFDPDRNVGYQFVSHAGDDVVTDFDFDVERRLRELDAQGITNVLIIHDYDAPDSDAVLTRVEAFLASFNAGP